MRKNKKSVENKQTKKPAVELEVPVQRVCRIYASHFYTRVTPALRYIEVMGPLITVGLSC